MPFGIGPWEIAVLLLVSLLIFGPTRLPEMGRSLGRGLREFKTAITGLKIDGEPDEPGLAVPPPTAAAQEQDPT